MRTIRTKVYQFSELSEQAKQKAIESCRDINTNYDDWHEPIIEGAIEDLIAAGFNEPKILYTGFWSQGDGACFTCNSIDFNKFLNGKYKGLDISANITHSWRYCFATSTTVNLYDEDREGELPENKYNEILKDIEDEREKLGNKIYRDLEKYYYELQEDEAVIDCIEANEYEFKADGTRF